MTKISDMEDWESQFDVGEMTDAFDGVQTTSFTKGFILGCALNDSDCY